MFIRCSWPAFCLISFTRLHFLSKTFQTGFTDWSASVFYNFQNQITMIQRQMCNFSISTIFIYTFWFDRNPNVVNSFLLYIFLKFSKHVLRFFWEILFFFFYKTVPSIIGQKVVVCPDGFVLFICSRSFFIIFPFF